MRNESLSMRIEFTQVRQVPENIYARRMIKLKKIIDVSRSTLIKYLNRSKSNIEAEKNWEIPYTTEKDTFFSSQYFTIVYLHYDQIRQMGFYYFFLHRCEMSNFCSIIMHLENPNPVSRDEAFSRKWLEKIFLCKSRQFYI